MANIATLDGQFDTVKEEGPDEDLIFNPLLTSAIDQVFSLIRYLQTRSHYVCPTIVMKTLSSIRPPTSDNDVYPHKRAHWTIFEEAVLIQYLFERKNEMASRTMFMDKVFKRAAEVLNRFHEKGGKKTSISCRSKWTKLKKTYKVVTMLKSKSGFVWDDVKGMCVTQEKRPAWDKLVQSNEHFKPFATNGWPHYEAMARLMPFRAKSAYTRRGTHESTAATMSTSAPSLSPTPSDISPRSTIPSSCKHESSPFDISSQSSSPNERILSPELVKEISEIIEGCVNRIHHLRQSRGYVHARSYALDRFIDNINKFKERGDEGLSSGDLVAMAHIISSHTTAAKAYIRIADGPNEDQMRWVRSQLESIGA